MSVQNRAKKMGRSIATRKVVTYRSGHFTGYVHSVKNNRMIQYESILERDFIQLAESDRGVAAYSEQPIPLEWTDGYETFRTTFDFRVERSDGRRYLVEIKPLSKVVKYRLDLLYGFARAAAKEAGYDDFELWTERELKAMPRLLNAELLVAGDTTFEDESFLLAALSAASDLRRSSDRTTVRAMRVASNLGEGAYWAVIRMVARGQLIPVDPAAPLDDNAVLTFAGSGR
jgi:hypothetical protein